MAEPLSPTLKTLGRQVKTYREAARLTQEALAARLGYTYGWLSNVERGRLRPRPEQVADLEKELDTPVGALMNIYQQLDGETLPIWFREWVDEESRAEILRTFQIALIPGLLQIGDYARALLRGDEEAVAQRMKRQEVLTRETPPLVHVVLDEAVLYQARGGRQVMRAQLERLLESVGPRLSLQVVLSEENPRSLGAFSIATVDGAEVGYVETAIRGIVTSSREDLSALSVAWEQIRTFALSQRDSIDLIRKVAEERWT